MLMSQKGKGGTLKNHVPLPNKPCEPCCNLRLLKDFRACGLCRRHGSCEFITRLVCRRHRPAQCRLQLTKSRAVIQPYLGMQNYGERLASLDGELTELRQRIPRVAARIGVVEDEIEDVQHALQDLECPTDVAEREVQRTEQTRTWLRQEKVRLAQREDRMRQEKANLMMLQLRLVEAKLQLHGQVSQERPSDIECGNLEKSLEEELVDHVEYRGCVRLIPPCLILMFLSALGVWFGENLVHYQPGLTTTQKVASIGSATFTVMTVVALVVRAAMCTGEWQWTLHACYCITGWRWLKPMPRQPHFQRQHLVYQQQQQQHQQQKKENTDAVAAYVVDTVPNIPQPPASEAASADNYHMDVSHDSPRSLDGFEPEEIKKQS